MIATERFLISRRIVGVLAGLGAALAANGVSAAEEVVAVSDEAATIARLAVDADTLWTCIAAFLVFFMQAGFAMVETGFTRAKNACNIIMKNLMDFSIGSPAG